LRDFANIISGFLSRVDERAEKTMSGFSNNMRGGMSRFLDGSFIREASWGLGPATQAARIKASYLVWKAWRRPWPLTARVPVVSGALILAVAVAASHVLMSTVAREQEIGVRRIAAVYLDGISTTIYPHVVARNLTNTTEALRRTMWFHQSMREQRALVRLPDGSLFADVSGPNGDPRAEDPFHDAGLRQRLEEQGGFFFDTETGLGWASRAIVRNDNHVADLSLLKTPTALLTTPGIGRSKSVTGRSRSAIQCSQFRTCDGKSRKAALVVCLVAQAKRAERMLWLLCRRLDAD
jgi:hypothetical protein